MANSPVTERSLRVAVVLQTIAQSDDAGDLRDRPSPAFLEPSAALLGRTIRNRTAEEAQRSTALMFDSAG